MAAITLVLVATKNYSDGDFRYVWNFMKQTVFRNETRGVCTISKIISWIFRIFWVLRFLGIFLVLWDVWEFWNFLYESVTCLEIFLEHYSCFPLFNTFYTTFFLVPFRSFLGQTKGTCTSQSYITYPTPLHCTASSCFTTPLKTCWRLIIPYWNSWRSNSSSLCPSGKVCDYFSWVLNFSSHLNEIFRINFREWTDKFS